MKSRRELTLGYAGFLSVLLLWAILGIAYSISSWFEPAPPGAMKMDALDEIAVTAGVLNAALPLSGLAVVVGFFLGRGGLIPIVLPIAGSILVLGITVCAVRWWTYMDEAHGPEISLTKNHLWWGR